MTSWKVRTADNGIHPSTCRTETHSQHYEKEIALTVLHKETCAAHILLPEKVFHCARIIQAKADKSGLIHLETKVYSTSPRFAQKKVFVQITYNEVQILDEDQQVIVTHPRLYGSIAKSMVWHPYLKLLSQRPRAFKYSGVYDHLPEEWQTYLKACTEEVKKALGLLCDAGIIKRVSHTSGNGLPLGAETNDKFRKYIYLDSGLLLRILDMDLGSAQQQTELIVAGTAEDLVNKGGLTEMVLGWELVKYNNPRSQHDLYYWENIADGARSEVDYIIARDMKVLPIECKAGTSGKMKSLHVFMRQKHLTDAIRCSLENFSLLENQDKQDENALRRITINPLYAISTLYNSITPAIPIP